jgi:hypothetical protein
LPLYLLGGSEDVALSLDLWGIRTFGEFAALPAIGVAARLGDEGINLQLLASGEGFRHLRVAKDRLEFQAETDYRAVQHVWSDGSSSFVILGTRCCCRG